MLVNSGNTLCWRSIWLVTKAGGLSKLISSFGFPPTQAKLCVLFAFLAPYLLAYLPYTIYRPIFTSTITISKSRYHA